MPGVPGRNGRGGSVGSQGTIGAPGAPGNNGNNVSTIFHKDGYLGHIYAFRPPLSVLSFFVPLLWEVFG